MVRIQKDKEKERVIVFNEEIKKHRKHDGSVMWGVVFIFAGVTFLLNNLGIISWDIWGMLWRFWPVLLVLGGLHIVLGNSSVSRFIVFVISVIVIGTLLVYLLKVTNPELIKLIPYRFVDLSNYWGVIAK